MALLNYGLSRYSARQESARISMVGVEWTVRV